jgi:hypothetical protein
MKTFIIFLLFLFPGFRAIAFETGGILKATVSGDTVILRDDSCRQNCGSIYRMIVTINGNHIIWMQKDTGNISNCDCGFNLSVSLANLEPGIYNTDVYYTHRFGGKRDFDTIYVGNISFEIILPNPPDSCQIYNPHQSDCFYIPLGIESDKTNNSSSPGYPNPFNDKIIIPYDNRGHVIDNVLILNIFGEVVRCLEIPADTKGQIVWDARNSAGSSLSAGTYIYSIRNGSTYTRYKITLMK